MVRRCRKSDESFVKFTASAFFLFQFHMIARLDDVAKFHYRDLKPHVQFDFALKSQMCWSKNVLEERDAPDQIILGAADEDFCTILALAVHFEHSIGSGIVNENTNMFALKKERISKLMGAIMAEDDFPLAGEGPVGSHSNRKLPGTCYILLNFNFADCCLHIIILFR